MINDYNHYQKQYKVFIKDTIIGCTSGGSLAWSQNIEPWPSKARMAMA